MFLSKKKRKVNLHIDIDKSKDIGSGGIPSLYKDDSSKVRIDSPHPMELSSMGSVSSCDSSPSGVTMRKKLKMFPDESMDTSSCSPVTLIKYTNQPFDDFKKPFDYFAEPMEPLKKGSESNRTSVSSLLSMSSLTGRSTYNLNKQSSLDKFDSFRKSSLDISSSSAKNMKNFISGVVTPRLLRKSQHSSSSDTLKSESTENMSQTSDSERGSTSSFTKFVQSVFRTTSQTSQDSVFPSREDLRNENKVFGKNLSDVPTYLDGKLFGSQTGYEYNGCKGTSHGMLRRSSTITESGIPEIIVRCVKKICKEKETVGIYRTNGESKAVKQLSDEIELGNYEDLEKCTSIATVTSVLKAFIRQMPEPLLTRDCQQLIEQAQIDFLGNSNEGLMVAQLKGIFMTMDSLTYTVLKYILLHLKDISEAKDNKMDAYNLAIVMAPVLMQTDSMEKRRISQVILAMETNVRLVEKLIYLVLDIFATS